MISPFRLLFIFLLFITYPVSAHENTTDRVSITIDEAGFSPSEITIEPHTTVTFTNTGSKNHWPATDSHPSHTNYDGTSLTEHCSKDSDIASFDSCTGIAPGESWSYTFEKVGSFAYHDHLWSHLGGTITVLEQKIKTKPKNNLQILWDKIKLFFNGLFSNPNTEVTTTETINGLLQSSSEQFDQTKNDLLVLLSETDPRITIAELKKRSAANNTVAAVCHDLLHEIGKASFEKYDDYAEAVAYQDDFCNSGYIHGLFEAMFSTGVIDPQDLTELCSEYAITGRPFDMWQCYHGIGHGFMYVTGGDLDESLSNCGKHLSGPAVPQCYNGVYMELFNNEILNSEPDFVDPSDPFKTCTNADRGKKDCYLYAPTYFTQNLGQSHIEALAACKDVSPIHRNSCINGVATEATKRNQNDLTPVFALCDTLSRSTEESVCVSGIAVMNVFQTASIDAALSKCATAPKKYQASCTETVEQMRPMFQ